jgi:threonine/homoserine/homoserine lactone efflux protein
VLGLAHVAAIACAGIMAVLRQRQWLRELYPSTRGAGRLVVVWLAVNLVVARARSPGTSGRGSARPDWRSSSCARIVRGDFLQSPCSACCWRAVADRKADR